MTDPLRLVVSHLAFLIAQYEAAGCSTDEAHLIAREHLLVHRLAGRAALRRVLLTAGTKGQ